MGEYMYMDIITRQMACCLVSFTIFLARKSTPNMVSTTFYVLPLVYTDVVLDTVLFPVVPCNHLVTVEDAIYMFSKPPFYIVQTIKIHHCV